MAEERIVKIQNTSTGDLPAHKPGAKDCVGFGCAGCAVPTWNRIEFPMLKGQTIVVKENVGTHLSRSFIGKITITGGPYDTTQLLQAPEGFFEHDAVTGQFKPLNIKVNTSASGSSQDADAPGEGIDDVKRSGRFIAKGGT